MASAPDALTAGVLLAERVRHVAEWCGVPDVHARQLLELAGHDVGRAIALHLGGVLEVPQHVQLAAAALQPPPPPVQILRPPPPPPDSYMQTHKRSKEAKERRKKKGRARRKEKEKEVRAALPRLVADGGDAVDDPAAALVAARAALASTTRERERERSRRCRETQLAFQRGRREERRSRVDIKKAERRKKEKAEKKAAAAAAAFFSAFSFFLRSAFLMSTRERRSSRRPRWNASCVSRHRRERSRSRSLVVLASAARAATSAAAGSSTASPPSATSRGSAARTSFSFSLRRARPFFFLLSFASLDRLCVCMYESGGGGGGRRICTGGGGGCRAAAANCTCCGTSRTPPRWSAMARPTSWPASSRSWRAWTSGTPHHSATCRTRSARSTPAVSASGAEAIVKRQSRLAPPPRSPHTRLLGGERR